MLYELSLWRHLSTERGKGGYDRNEVGISLTNIKLIHLNVEKKCFNIQLNLLLTVWFCGCTNFIKFNNALTR